MRGRRAAISPAEQQQLAIGRAVHRAEVCSGQAHRGIQPSVIKGHRAGPPPRRNKARWRRAGRGNTTTSPPIWPDAFHLMWTARRDHRARRAWTRRACGRWCLSDARGHAYNGRVDPSPACGWPGTPDAAATASPSPPGGGVAHARRSSASRHSLDAVARRHGRCACEPAVAQGRTRAPDRAATAGPSPAGTPSCCRLDIARTVLVNPLVRRPAVPRGRPSAAAGAGGALIGRLRRRPGCRRIYRAIHAARAGAPATPLELEWLPGGARSTASVRVLGRVNRWRRTRGTACLLRQRISGAPRWFEPLTRAHHRATGRSGRRHALRRARGSAGWRGACRAAVPLATPRTRPRGRERRWSLAGDARDTGRGAAPRCAVDGRSRSAVRPHR